MFQHSMVCISIFILAMLLALPTGRYMSKLYNGDGTLLNFLNPFEKFLFRISGLDPSAAMNAKQYFLALIVINLVLLVAGCSILLVQDSLFLNPAVNPSMEWILAINPTVGFLTGLNLQHYSGETGATYLSQVVVSVFFQFVSAATALSVAVALVRGLSAESYQVFGNFYSDFVKSITRILLPFSIITGILFLFRGVPSTFTGPKHIVTLQGDSSKVATGPVAAFLPIKEPGSNGGGFFGANNAHPNGCIPAGTPVGFHNSFMPMSGGFMLLSMNVDAFFGGAGTGWINMFIFLVIALFIGSLMIGRTPELFGKKIGVREIQIIAGVNVLQNLIPLVLAAIACFIYIYYSGGNDSLQWLTNKGAHGFTTFLYEYVSSVAGNGSGFESLGDNTVFWNLTTSIAMLTGRFVPLAGVLWIAGRLQDKLYTPARACILKMQGVTFGVFLFCIIIIINVLLLFPSLML